MPTVEVYIWNKTSDKDVGHTAVRIGNWVYGYYPTDIDGDGAYTLNDLKNSPGVMHINSLSEFNTLYSGDAITAFTLNPTADQAADLEINLLGVAQNPGYYGLLGNQCTTVAYTSLQSAGFGIVNSSLMPGGIAVPPPITMGMSPSAFQAILSSPLNSTIGPVQSSRTFTVGR